MSLRSSLKKVLPPISVTEQEALEAGDVWLEASIFRGQPDMQSVRAMPLATFSEEEQAFMDGPLQTLLGMVDDYELNNTKHIPQEILDFLGKNKFFALIIPKKFGGLEFSPYANSCIVTTIGSKSAPLGVTVMVPNSLGPGELLMHFGTAAQQDYWLPRLADGRDLPCFALTSPEAGSDAGAIPDYGVVCKEMYNGEETLGFRLNWDKRYITLAPIATVLGLAFKAYDPDGLLGGDNELGITCALLPKSHPGVEIGNRHDPMGITFYNGTTRGKDVFIPMDFLVGGQTNIGRGWQMLMSCLGAGRGISLPAVGTAGTQAGFKAATEYSFVREQFGVPIGRFEGVQDMLADMAGKTFAVDAMRVLTTEGLGLGYKPSVITAMAKYHMTELGRDVTNQAMDVLGGKAIQKGPQNTIANGYYALPVGITVEGANILTRSLMIFGQGVMRCHPYLQEMVELIHSNDKSADKQFNKVLLKTVGYSVANALRSLRNTYLPFTRKAAAQDALVAKYEKRFNALSAKLAPLADLSLLVLGGNLKKAELLSARLGDVMSYTYMAMAMIRYYEQRIEDKADAAPYFEYGMQWALSQGEAAMAEFIANFPSTPARLLMRFLTGTYSTAVTKVSDNLVRTLAQQSLQTGRTREQITARVAVVAGDGHDINEQAFFAKHKVMPLLSKVQKALRANPVVPFVSFAHALNVLHEKGLLDKQELADLLDYNHKRELSVRVDEFDFDMHLLQETDVHSPLQESHAA